MSSYIFTGVHILVDLYGIKLPVLNDIDEFITLLDPLIRRSGATQHGTLIKKFTPQGITILILLAESHLSVHTYPENNSLFLDIFTCGNNCTPEFIVDSLIEILKPTKKRIEIIKRGC